MTGNIYLIKKNDELVEMNEKPYDSEDLLQQLLAKYPNLLAGDQMDDTAPRRWLLVSREASLPSEEDGAGRWSVDHLFLDQDGIPTLVEVKRSSDTRIRREVVGQMLDYAANALAYWPEETIRARFEARCESQGFDPIRKVSDLRGIENGEEGDVEAFWSQVKTNLQAGRVRLVFVADEIPQELRSIVEFLNTQMDPAEVLAVEIKQYVGDKLTTLVPRVMGQRAKSRPAKKKWDEASFFRELQSRRDSEEAAVARSILEWAKARALRIRWGGGGTDGSLVPLVDSDEATQTLFAVWTYGKLELQFEYMTTPPFVEKSLRLEFLNRLNEILPEPIPSAAISGRPSVPLVHLKDEAPLKGVLEALAWAVERIRSS